MLKNIIKYTIGLPILVLLTGTLILLIISEILIMLLIGCIMFPVSGEFIHKDDIHTDELLSYIKEFWLPI